ncbi:MAG: UDP-N-acetylglucosamine 2-epimerase (non-hydrolyzing), partial [Deltaproteobacteria bacterium]|nr:UDP-N-acetylglucosamine 2-epimerase (non-hydrolyzing) [Deltaproteobacteria bacterium]
MKKLKVMTIVGTRPEIIRLSEVIRKLRANLDHVLVHTGQNYDYELNQVFFDDLGLAPPDRVLDVKGMALGEQLGRILSGTEPILVEERPDAVLILGDTNSSIAGIMARRHKIPLFHMEAGNRCFDDNVPEEINRRIIDHISDVNLAYTENSRRYLLAEGLPRDRVFVTGSPMREVLAANRERIRASAVLEELGLQPGGFFLVSMHREENVDREEHLKKLLAALNGLASQHRLPVVVTTHPRTRKRMDALGQATDPLVRFCKPFSFSAYVRLQVEARCTLSDSGTISEESAILGFPAVTIREAIERPEALDAGSILMTGIDRD